MVHGQHLHAMAKRRTCAGCLHATPCPVVLLQDFGGFRVVADIGGGYGRLLEDIMDTYPGVPRVQDLGLNVKTLTLNPCSRPAASDSCPADSAPGCAPPEHSQPTWLELPLVLWFISVRRLTSACCSARLCLDSGGAWCMRCASSCCFFKLPPHCPSQVPSFNGVVIPVVQAFRRALCLSCPQWWTCCPPSLTSIRAKSAGSR